MWLVGMDDMRSFPLGSDGQTAAPLPVLGPGGPALRVGLPPDTRVAVVCCTAVEVQQRRLAQPDRPVRRHTVGAAAQALDHGTPLDS